MLLVSFGASARQQLVAAGSEAVLLALVAAGVALPAAALVHSWLTHLTGPAAAGLAQAPTITGGLVLTVLVLHPGAHPGAGADRRRHEDHVRGHPAPLGDRPHRRRLDPDGCGRGGGRPLLVAAARPARHDLRPRGRHAHPRAGAVPGRQHPGRGAAGAGAAARGLAAGPSLAGPGAAAVGPTGGPASAPGHGPGADRGRGRGGDVRARAPLHLGALAGRPGRPAGRHRPEPRRAHDADRGRRGGRARRGRRAVHGRLGGDRPAGGHRPLRRHGGRSADPGRDRQPRGR